MVHVLVETVFLITWLPEFICDSNRKKDSQKNFQVLNYEDGHKPELSSFIDQTIFLHSNKYNYEPA